MKVSSVLRYGVLTAAISFVAACGNQGGGISSLEDFRTKYDQTDGACPTWTSERNPLNGSVVDGKCDHGTHFTLYSTRKAMLGSLIGIHASELALADFLGLEPTDQDLVVGPDWILREGNASIREKFVGDFEGESVRLLDKDEIGRFRDELVKKDLATSMAVLVSSCIDTELDDGGSSLTIDTKGSDDAVGDEIVEAFCALRALNAPDYLIELMQTTRAMDGRQSEEWDGYRADWSYHPDSGLQLTIIQAL